MSKDIKEIAKNLIELAGPKIASAAKNDGMEGCEDAAEWLKFWMNVVKVSQFCVEKSER